jgi:hypothetical protein
VQSGLASSRDHGYCAIWIAFVIALPATAPLVVHPVFVTKALCFALFASAFYLLVGRASRHTGGATSHPHAREEGRIR